MKRESILQKCLVLCLIVLAAVTGCKSPCGRESISVKMLPGGKCSVAGEVISTDHMGRALKAAGARRNTRVRVTLPPDATESSMRSLSRTLSAAGFHTLHFQTPRIATSYVSPDKRAGQSTRDR